MQPVHQVVQFILAASNEGERDDLSLRKHHERALTHSELVVACLNIARLAAERFAEISAQQLPRLNFKRIWFAFGLKAFGGREFSKGAQVVFGFLEAGI